MYCSNCGNESTTETCQNCNHTQAQGNYPTTQQESSFDNPISLKHWLLNLLVLCIPLVGWVFLIVWALGVGNTSDDKKDYARASIIIISVAMLIFIMVFSAIFLAVIFSSLSSY